MPSDAPISFTFAGLPVGYCFTSPERFALDIAAGLAGYVPGEYSVVIKSESEPAVEDRGKLWHKPSTGHVYHYDGGWISKNPEEASGDARRIFVGAESDAWSYDGGDGTNPTTDLPTDKTGAMWERDTTFNFRFPLGVGTSPAPNSTVVAVGATGGEEKHELTQNELPENLTLTANLPGYKTNLEAGPPQWLAPLASSGLAQTTPAYEDGSFPFTNTDGGESHNTMPPYVGVFFIRRTARQYYTA